MRAVGVVRFGWVGSCRRCLGEARGEAEASFEELFADAGSAPAAGEDLPEVHEGWIDLEPVVRDTVLLGLPLAPVCRPDCPGPAPVEFPVVLEDDLEDDRAGADAPEGRGPDPDPRWAPLAGLRFDPEDDHPLP